MNYHQAKNLLDEVKAGAQIPQHLINQALFLTGDLSENELCKTNGCNNTEPK